MERVLLSSVYFFQEGPGVRKWQFRDKGIKLLNGGNINNGKLDLSSTSIYLSEEEVENKYKHFLIDDGDLLIACSGIVVENFHNKIAFASKENLPLCLNTSTMRFKSLDKNHADLKYLKYFLQTRDFKLQIGKLITGSAQLNFGPSHIKQIYLPLPDLATQKAIAAKLDKADEIRQLNKKLIEQYDALTQSLFLDMFGDPVKNEKGWEVKMLKDLSKKIHSGNTPKGGSDVYVKKGVTFFRSQNVWKNKLIYEDIAFIDEKTHLSMSKSSLLHKDILMTKTGRINTENSSLGRAALYLGKDNEANVNGHVYFIRLKENNVHEFIMYILTSKQYRDLIRSVCVGGIDKRQLNKDHIENFPIIFPSLPLQNEFAERVKAIEAQKALAQQALQQSEDLFNSLLQESFQ